MTVPYVVVPCIPADCHAVICSARIRVRSDIPAHPRPEGRLARVERVEAVIVDEGLPADETLQVGLEVDRDRSG